MSACLEPIESVSSDCTSDSSSNASSKFLDRSSDSTSDRAFERNASSVTAVAARLPVGVQHSQTQDEQKLVQRILAGDRQAFGDLLDTYETRVYRLALRFTGTVSDAEDVTQEIFLGVYKSITNFRGNAALGTWIYRIAMNHCLEFRRKRKLDSIPYDEELTLASHDWRENPEQSASKSELSAHVKAALNCLSPLHRDVIVLHELQGLTYQEVASALNVPVGTVKSRLSNAFRRLRDLLGNYVSESTCL